MKTFLLNAFSLQMVDAPCNVRFTEVDALPEGLTSAIGHQDTANVLGVPMNRVNVSLKDGDSAYVAQLQGGRLPEGATTLPEGFSFKFIKADIRKDDPNLVVELDWVYSLLNSNHPISDVHREQAKEVLVKAMKALGL